MSPTPRAPQRVLPTLNEDGTRRRIRPRLYDGVIFRRRRLVAWGLFAAFIGLPFVSVNGRPALLLDVAAREFTFGGRTFFATDGVFLMLLLLGIFVAVLLITALVGRGFCGWVCPQTVYMEFLFRPIERLFEGDRNAQLILDRKGGGWRRVAKNVVFLLLSFVVANIFLAYFVGVEKLSSWMTHSPAAHPGGFLVVATTAALVFLDFAYFREQMCTVACPYARLQAALLDANSLLIGYDEKRGEPRKKGRPDGTSGDCIDCGACVATCPTGIDIRDGLQLECIACGQCIDACNTIMPKVGKPLDLIRYASERSLKSEKTKILRPRVALYAVLLAVIVGGLAWLLVDSKSVDVTVLRGVGAPFVELPGGVQNQIRIKLENRTGERESYELELGTREAERWAPLTEQGFRVVLPENPLIVEARGHRTTSAFLLAPKAAFQKGRRVIVVRVRESNGVEQEVTTTLLGPSH